MSTMTDLESWRLFFRVAARGSVTKVAEELSVEPSSVSRRISRLEKDLGALLFNRVGKQMILTDAGSIAYSRMRRIVFDASTLFADLAKTERSDLRSISIAAPIGLSERVLPILMAEYHRMHPQLNFSLRAMSYVELFSADALDGYDIIFTNGSAIPSGRNTRLIAGITHFLAATPQYLKGKGPIRTPKDLANHDLFSFYSQNRERNISLRKGNEYYPLHIHPSFRFNHPGAVKTAVMHSCGIGLYCPKYFYSADLIEGSVVEILPEWKMPIQQAYISRRSDSDEEITAFCEWISARIVRLPDFVSPSAEGFWASEFSEKIPT